MKKLIGITALVSGLLLLLLPRYILPACEYAGYPPMHCSDTARAEYVAGAVLMLIGIAAFFLQDRMLIVSAVTACIVFGISFWLPDIFGYCQSTRMPCNYGMVPGIRFIDGAGALLMIIAVINLLKRYRTKGKA